MAARKTAREKHGVGRSNTSYARSVPRRPSSGAGRTFKRSSQPKKRPKPKFDLFAEGYVEAAIFFDLPEGSDASLSIYPSCLAQMLKDCACFQKDNKRLLNRAYRTPSDEGDYNQWHAGRDFWLSRQGHWIGFSSRGLDDVGDRLEEAASEYTSVDVLAGDSGDDDGKQYIFIE